MKCHFELSYSTEGRADSSWQRVALVRMASFRWESIISRKAFVEGSLSSASYTPLNSM